MRSYYESNRFSGRWRTNLAGMVKKLLPDGWEGMALLDIGVGDGYTIRLVKPEGRVTGIDFDTAEVAAARARGIEAREGSAYHLPFGDETFELVTSFEVIEHLESPTTALKEMERILRKGGYLVLSTPVPSLRWKLVWWFWTKLGPGKRWEKIPHVNELRLGRKGDGELGLVEMLSGLDLHVLRTAKCNYGMVAGLVARKRA